MSLESSYVFLFLLIFLFYFMDIFYYYLLLFIYFYFYLFNSKCREELSIRIGQSSPPNWLTTSSHIFLLVLILLPPLLVLVFYLYIFYLSFILLLLIPLFLLKTDEGLVFVWGKLASEKMNGHESQPRLIQSLFDKKYPLTHSLCSLP